MSHNNPTGILSSIARATFNQWGMGENGQRPPPFLWWDGSAAVPVRFLRGTPVSPELGCPQRWQLSAPCTGSSFSPPSCSSSLPPTSWDHPPKPPKPQPSSQSLIRGAQTVTPGHSKATLRPCSESHWVLCRITGLVTLPCGYRTRGAIKARTTSVSFTLVPQGLGMLAEQTPATHLLPKHQEGKEAALGFFDSENAFLF